MGGAILEKIQKNNGLPNREFLFLNIINFVVVG
jgi:hypothetical protein